MTAATNSRRYTRKTVGMKTFAFKTTIDAVVRVHAADEDSARKVVPTVLGAPGTTEIALANEANTATGQDARVTDVGFSIASLTPINGGGDRSVTMKDSTAPAPAARPRQS
jgi:hypothetical protein